MRWLALSGLTLDALAARLGTTHQHVSNWMAGTGPIPLAQAGAIADISSGAVPWTTWQRVRNPASGETWSYGARLGFVRRPRA